MISLVIHIRCVGYCARASYAICTARSTPQQKPYDCASRSVTSPRVCVLPAAFMAATRPPVETAPTPAASIAAAASSSRRCLRE